MLVLAGRLRVYRAQEVCLLQMSHALLSRSADLGPVDDVNRGGSRVQCQVDPKPSNCGRSSSKVMWSLSLKIPGAGVSAWSERGCL